MNNKQKIHQIKLEQWAERFRRQASSGLTVKEWCTENNFTIHTYNYWKHLLKQEYVDSAFHGLFGSCRHSAYTGFPYALAQIARFAQHDLDYNRRYRYSCRF